MDYNINFPHLGIYLDHVGKNINIGGFTIAFYGIIIASAMIIGLLQNGLNLMSVPSTQHGLVRGLVIIAAVGFDALQRDTKFQSWLAKRRQARAAGKSAA